MTKTDTCANRVNPDVTVHSVFDFRLKPILPSVDMSKFKDGSVHIRNSGMKELISELS